MSDGEIMLKKHIPVTVEERQDLLDEIEKTAKLYEEKYGGCARNTLAGIQEHIELCNEDKFRTVFQSTDALTGGVAYHQKMCGAVIAGVMAISLVYGPDKMEVLLPQGDLKSSEAIRKHREAVERGHDFVRRFEREFGGMTCKEVQHRVTGRYWDMRKHEDLAIFITKPYHDKCGLVTGKAARLAAEVILEPSESYV
jgi:hypothetical protein